MAPSPAASHQSSQSIAGRSRKRRNRRKLRPASTRLGVSRVLPSPLSNPTQLRAEPASTARVPDSHGPRAPHVACDGESCARGAGVTERRWLTAGRGFLDSTISAWALLAPLFGVRFVTMSARGLSTVSLSVPHVCMGHSLRWDADVIARASVHTVRRWLLGAAGDARSTEGDHNYVRSWALKA